MGRPGDERSPATVILLSIVTCGIYTIWWAYRAHEDVKQYSGEGVGGAIGVLIWIVASFVSGFLLPAEIEKAFQRTGRPSPVTGMTGLWWFPGVFLIIPPFIWLAKVQGALNELWAGER